MNLISIILSESPSRSSPESSLGSLESEIEESVRRWLFRRMEAGDLTSDGDLEAGDLDGLIKRFLHLKEVRSPGVPDLDGSFQEDDLFKQTQQNTSASDYQWFNDELGSVIAQTLFNHHSYSLYKILSIPTQTF